MAQPAPQLPPWHAGRRPLGPAPTRLPGRQLVIERIQGASAPTRPATPPPALPRRERPPGLDARRATGWVVLGGLAGTAGLVVAVLVALVAAVGVGRWWTERGEAATPVSELTPSEPPAGTPGVEQVRFVQQAADGRSEARAPVAPTDPPSATPEAPQPPPAKAPSSRSGLPRAEGAAPPVRTSDSPWDVPADHPRL